MTGLREVVARDLAKKGWVDLSDAELTILSVNSSTSTPEKTLETVSSHQSAPTERVVCGIAPGVASSVGLQCVIPVRARGESDWTVAELRELVVEAHGRLGAARVVLGIVDDDDIVSYYRIDAGLPKAKVVQAKTEA